MIHKQKIRWNKFDNLEQREICELSKKFDLRDDRDSRLLNLLESNEEKRIITRRLI